MIGRNPHLEFQSSVVSFQWSVFSGETGKKATDNQAFRIHHSQFTVALQPRSNDSMSYAIEPLVH
jgi:hypothetical protein